jgi:hypothetical protein
LVTKAALANQRSPSHPLSITFPHVSNLKRNHTAFGQFLPRFCQDFGFPHSAPVFGLVGLRQQNYFFCSYSGMPDVFTQGLCSLA